MAPLWLCDLAILLESSNNFDWNLCLGKDPRRENWILAAIGLAHTLLNASMGDKEIAARAERVPVWLKQEVLKQWETPFPHLQSPFNHRAPISFYLRRPRGLWSDLARRWPNPIVATISVKGTFGARRRTRYEFGNWLLRAARAFPPPSGEEVRSRSRRRLRSHLWVVYVGFRVCRLCRHCCDEIKGPTNWYSTPSNSDTTHLLFLNFITPIIAR